MVYDPMIQGIGAPRGWFWADMRLACSEVRRAAVERIAEIMQ